MKRLFDKWLEKWLCSHQWKSHNKTKIFSDYRGDIPVKVRETLICDKCGKIKQISL